MRSSALIVSFTALLAILCVVGVSAKPSLRLRATHAAECNSTCINEPWNTFCADCELPKETIKKGIDDGCGMMDYMPSCTIDRLCKAHAHEIGSSVYCTPMSIWKDMCFIDMDMGNCEELNAMCKPSNSTVKQCQTPTLPLPKKTTMVLRQRIISICTSMSMQDCERCPGSNVPDSKLTCDLLDVYSSLCMEMPDMEECKDWKTMCEEIPDWPICANSDGSSNIKPAMRMWFHWSLAEWVLFKEWAPTTPLAFAGTWFAVCAMAFLHEMIKFARVRLEKRWERYIGKKEESTPLNSVGDDLSINAKGPRFYFAVDVPRALMAALETTWSLLVMLIAMTFNIALFLAIPTGCFIGQLFVGRFMVYKPSSSCH